ncbi:MAG: hypothetical protein H7067_10860 [Burkholderiales bacterium]|nr:hypothetical protein [Opitutaceae bacterium]
MRIIILALLLAASAYGQGSLTPPGAPAPTMKSLEQLSAQIAATEPRIPINNITAPPASGLGAVHYITQPGSYYLTGNLVVPADMTTGIYIGSANVTLDLGGFTISHTNVSGGFFVTGVYCQASSVANLVVRNGTLAGPSVRTDGAQFWLATFTESGSRGIYVKSNGSSVSVPGMRFENLTLRNWGFAGIDMDFYYDGRIGRAVVQNCTFIDIAALGVRGRSSVIRDSNFSQIGSHALEVSNSVIDGVVIERVGGHGISGNLNTVRAVNLRWLGLDGVSGSQHTITEVNVTGARNGVAVDDSVISDSSLSNNRAHGLTGLRNTARQVVARANAERGFNGDRSSYSGVIASLNTGEGMRGTGLMVDGATLINNSASGLFGPGSSVRGVIATANTGAGIWCDDSTISDSTAFDNAADGIRGVNSLVSGCRALGNDTNKTDGYSAFGIYWFGGRLALSLADTASPVIP